jgi:hypothetical protein
MAVDPVYREHVCEVERQRNRRRDRRGRKRNPAYWQRKKQRGQQRRLMRYKLDPAFRERIRAHGRAWYKNKGRADYEKKNAWKKQARQLSKKIREQRKCQQAELRQLRVLAKNDPVHVAARRKQLAERSKKYYANMTPEQIMRRNARRRITDRGKPWVNEARRRHRIKDQALRAALKELGWWDSIAKIEHLKRPVKFCTDPVWKLQYRRPRRVRTSMERKKGRRRTTRKGRMRMKIIKQALQELGWMPT